MQIPDNHREQSLKPGVKQSVSDLSLRAIAYSIDTLIPGLYLWMGSIHIRLGGSFPEEN
jgi:hypothetical protein